MDNLTDKQKAVLKFIEKYQMKNGRSPTLRELREGFNVSSDNSILKHLKALEAKGFIEKDETARGIALLDSVRDKLTSNIIKIPLLGMIPAGGPVLSEEYVDDWVGFEKGFVEDLGNSFMLRVTGESMIDAGIYEGDLVIASFKAEPRVGDIVVALIDGGNTLKRFVKEGGRAFLRAENSTYSNPDIVPIEELTIQGVVKGLVRTY
ncbi:repressor LexA [Candidatus Peregrinibacteria bacterium]|jgi:repressor LexA|nr:repressor LexA [Candidatus Peregrinibacteria bacterium]MBT4148650.1 repressor LexA [Candidatus Peregrinibacteria bacterium]MBT4366344.1 repressor LexA [Candidatus Peregrinibacteria bacterium]MBT4456019.1 repressor LexA [Candidatus Peregrinibacteria bacterium]